MFSSMQDGGGLFKFNSKLDTGWLRWPGQGTSVNIISYKIFPQLLSHSFIYILNIIQWRVFNSRFQSQCRRSSEVWAVCRFVRGDFVYDKDFQLKKQKFIINGSYTIFSLTKNNHLNCLSFQKQFQGFLCCFINSKHLKYILWSLQIGLYLD